MITSETSKRIVVLVVVAALLLIGGSTWVFAHGGDVNLIHACVNNSSGTLKIVGPNASCKNNETALDWGIVGPAGTAGPQGPAGPQGELGPAGPAGASGVSGYQVTGGSDPVSESPNKTAYAFCPPGETALGGGAYVGGGDGMVVLHQNYPLIYSEDAVGWVASASAIPGYTPSWGLNVYVICANVQ